MMDKSEIVKKEEEIMEFWQKNKIFEKSVEKPASKKTKKEYIFFDGPPFATGLPHYGHILAGIIKDVIPRYWTMRGKRVERRWGWDCHGLPIENEIEKDLGLKTRKEIEVLGIKIFNEAARKKVLKYALDWKNIIHRIGRWVDMENDYKTMDVDYMESVLWVFKKLYDKGLVYNDFRVSPYCVRCNTSLSNFELNQPDAYKSVEDQSIYVKFPIFDSKFLNTYFLVWTTTPWTLPANAALAVGAKISYVKIGMGKNKFILAKERLSVLEGPYKIEEEFFGKDLLGLRYKPFYGAGLQFKAQSKKLYSVVAADFVSAEDGTGIVHIAPAFGEDDMVIGRKEGLPMIITVDREGKIIKNTGIPGEGFFVKKANEEIKKDLKKRDLLYKEEKITHNYPHCWRCETPLIYYPISAWYVAVVKIKDRLIKNNKLVNWVPLHIKVGRFGKWLEDARDWNVSRSRFWGAPIPVWKCEKCEKIKVVGSIKELKTNAKKSGNNYFVMRHGEAETNFGNIVSSDKRDVYHLTEKGRKQSLFSARKLEKIKIDLIFSSDVLRAKETSKIVADRLNLKKESIIFDKRLREINFGVFENRQVAEYRRFFSCYKDRFVKTPKDGENFAEIKSRVADFLYEIESIYSNKNILIISHEAPISLMFAGALGADIDDAIRLVEGRKENFIKLSEIKEMNFSPIPHDDNFEIDLHRPYIDDVVFECSCGAKMSRIEDVFDCWFESGSMPYGQTHYPFENKNRFERNFPAEFIAEGLDQTRGWFYTLLVISSALFSRPAYKNVIVNGMVLAENGQKMSKRLKNYPDPLGIISRYGADSLRFYVLSSPAVRAEDLNFSEKGVDEIHKRIFLRLWNVCNFYELYAKDFGVNPQRDQSKSLHIVDKWILARIEDLKFEVSASLEKYELDKAVRSIADFVDDLSIWYIRRSRERFKLDSKNKRQGAVSVTRLVLIEFSKIIAPFAPFMGEAIYQRIASDNQQQKIKSVHLESWPKINKKNTDKKLLEEMRVVRKIVSLALEARAAAEIKVRQPLKELRVKSCQLKNKKELIDLIKDEANVKAIIFDEKIKNEVELNVEITSELKNEGIIRELIRGIQDLRKKAGFSPGDGINLCLEAPKEIENIAKKNTRYLQERIGAKNIKFQRSESFDKESEIQIDGQKILVGIKKF